MEVSPRLFYASLTPTMVNPGLTPTMVNPGLTPTTVTCFTSAVYADLTPTVLCRFNPDCFMQV
jgi:hypothetical protein